MRNAHHWDKGLAMKAQHMLETGRATDRASLQQAMQEEGEQISRSYARRMVVIFNGRREAAKAVTLTPEQVESREAARRLRWGPPLGAGYGEVVDNMDDP